MHSGDYIWENKVSIFIGRPIINWIYHCHGCTVPFVTCRHPFSSRFLVLIYHDLHGNSSCTCHQISRSYFAWDITTSLFCIYIYNPWYSLYTMTQGFIGPQHNSFLSTFLYHCNAYDLLVGWGLWMIVGGYLLSPNRIGV